jgi:O-acetyl-ADP-ribose deacetylase (regulator of RNase III)
MILKLRETTLELYQGDITTLQVDAIANAANSGLLSGGGVDGAIHSAGGPAILAECRQLYPDGCPTGQAVATTAGNLPAKIVVHAVGPVWHDGDHGEPDLLHSAYANSLRRAEERGMTSIAFPSISTGIYGYPIELACPIAVGAALDHLRQGSILQRIVFCLFSSYDSAVYERHFQQLASAAPDLLKADEPGE